MRSHEPDDFTPEGPVEIPITWELDLHPFRPEEMRDLLDDYIGECRKRNILTVRLIHGKGVGNLCRSVHAILSRHPAVISFSQAGEQFGGWGATIAHLRPGVER
jgi:DNA-nicking Smr family endonuclease